MTMLECLAHIINRLNDEMPLLQERKVMASIEAGLLIGLHNRNWAKQCLKESPVMSNSTEQSQQSLVASFKGMAESMS